MSPPPEPLPPTLVSLLLEYIAPPSLLSPLPPHLISTPLAQRHHFLHITPDQPSQYLAWPSDLIPNAQQLAVDLLESVQTPIHYPVYTIRYTTDTESFFAHVAISTQNPPGLRLVFQWASPDGWKFHNLALMPFPPDSYDSIHDMLAIKSHNDPSIVDNDEDSYWDAYGHTDDSDYQGSKPKAELEQISEDAYWAQYSSVHGSADSARPTPPTITRKLENEFENERLVVEYPSHRTYSAYNPLAPPSPRRLAHLLANITPRVSSPPLDDSDSGFDSASVSEKIESPSVAPPSELLSTETYTPSLQISSAVSPAIEQTAADETRFALKNTIRSVYQLWRAGRVIDSSTSDGDREEFLEIVRQALDQ